MHRLYSMFPPGFPGAGLVLLRLAVAITLWPLPVMLQAWPLGHLLIWRRPPALSSGIVWSPLSLDVIPEFRSRLKVEVRSL